MARIASARRSFDGSSFLLTLRLGIAVFALTRSAPRSGRTPVILSRRTVAMALFVAMIANALVTAPADAWVERHERLQLVRHP